MTAITIWQPWASLLACGAKKYETRGWLTNYRGPIAIHAGKKSLESTVMQFDIKTFNAVMEALPGEYRYRLANENHPRGYVIATAELVGCHPIEFDLLNKPFIGKGTEKIPITGNEALFGDWRPGRYAWEFANMTMLPEPIPAKGKQGLWLW